MRYGSDITALPSAGVGTAAGGIVMASSTGMLNSIWAFLLVSICISIVAGIAVVRQRVNSPWVHNGQE